MDGANNGRSIWASPSRSRELICFFGIVTQEVFDWTGYLLHLTRNIKQIHLVIFVPHLVRNTTGPCLDFVEVELFFVVPRLADVDVLIWRKPPGTSLVEPSDEHYVAAVDNVCNRMVAVLACLDHLVYIKVFLETMNCLLWPVVPTSINPLLASTILPCAEYLSNNGLC